MPLLNASIARCVILFTALIAWSAGCSGETATTVPVSCIITLSSSSANYAASDSMGSLVVNTPTDCWWSANSDADWISITGDSSGRGSGSVTYLVAGNPTNSDREAAISVVAPESGGNVVIHRVIQSGAPELRLRGAYTFVLEVDPDGRCGWPETKFYWPVVVKETSHTEGTTTGSIRFPATSASPSSTWNIYINANQIELVPDQQSSGVAGRAFKVVVDGGSWLAGGLSQAPDGRGQIKGGSVSGAIQTLTLRDSDERWECQSEAKWSLIIRYTDKD